MTVKKWLPVAVPAALMLAGCTSGNVPAQAQMQGRPTGNDAIMPGAAPLQMQGYRPVEGRLMTRWAKDVSPSNALPEYPRPQMARKNWQSLNGLWDYALSAPASTQMPANIEGRILVPYPMESALSGVAKASAPDRRLWYRRTFAVPAAWKGQRVLLHFGAVNWDSTVLLNGKQVGAHRGGYDGFDLDITPGLKAGQNELAVSAWNPINTDNPTSQVVGKQRLRPESIFYTGATGIWQSVWLEPVPRAFIASLKMAPDIDRGVLHLTVNGAGATGTTARIEALSGGKTVARIVGATGRDLLLPVKNARLWTPDTPNLYDLRVTLLQGGKAVDSVNSYFAMRKISLGKDAQGRNRIFLNNKFVFQVGALDQGYWPDGIYTAPTDAALRYDVEAAKKLGFNLLRKHAKTEPARWYYHCDRLGMLVWQDMPQAFGDNFTPETKAQWDAEWHRIIAQLYNYPSIVVWTTFNEGWGQHDTERVVAFTKQLDPTRLVNNASGWVDKGVGDMHDTHHYPEPATELPSATRAAVNGEFGGVALSVEGHRWINGAQIMAYGAVQRSNRTLTKRYQDLIKIAYRLRDERGMSAYVYTQITDVEQEINGLLTYDRAIIKADAGIVAAANRGQFPALPPDPNPPLLPTSEETPQPWRYSFTAPAADWTQPGFNDAAWQTGQAGFGHDSGGVRTPWNTPDIWLRREVTLPAVLPANIAFLLSHDEDTEIYVNGVLALQVPDYNGGYESFPLSPQGRAALKPGRNVIAAHVRQTAGGQFFDLGIINADQK